MRATRSTILSSTMPHLSPSPRHLCPSRAPVQPGNSSPPPQGMSHPWALPFPSLLPLGKSHTFSSPKRLFPAGILAPWSCPKPWPCLWPLQQHRESLCLPSPAASAPQSPKHPHCCPQLSSSPKSARAHPGPRPPPPHSSPVPHGLLGLPGWGQAVVRGTC